MDRYIGLDAHASSCTLGVMTPSGKRVGSHVVETNARCLIEAVRQIPEPRHICLEEGTLSASCSNTWSAPMTSYVRAVSASCCRAHLVFADRCFRVRFNREDRESLRHQTRRTWR